MPKRTSNFIELSKFRFYLLLQSMFIGVVLLYQLVWYIFGKNTIAECFVYGRQNELNNSGTVMYRFVANGKLYEDYDARSGIDVSQNSVEIKYLTFAPTLSCINCFESNWLGYLIAYGIFFTITSIIILIPNDTMPRNSFFYFTKQRPYVHMIVK